MDVTPLIPEGRYIITGYDSGKFLLNGEVVLGSIILLPDKVIAWQVADVSSITESSLEAIIAHKNEISLLLLGTGTKHLFLAPLLRHYLKRHGITVEVMATGAACRTYNVLLSEERKVAAALIAIEK